MSPYDYDPDRDPYFNGSEEDEKVKEPRIDEEDGDDYDDTE